MSDYTVNHIRIEGGDFNQFLSSYDGKFDKYLDFNKIIPRPIEIENYSAQREWNYKNWGTETGAFCYEVSPNAVVFETANGEPDPIIERMAKISGAKIIHESIGDLFANGHDYWATVRLYNFGLERGELCYKKELTGTKEGGDLIKSLNSMQPKQFDWVHILGLCQTANYWSE